MAAGFETFGRIIMTMSGPWSVVPWFVLAALIVDVFADSAPRDDAIGVSGVLCAAALVVLGPWQAFTVAVGSVFLSRLAQRRWNFGRMIVLISTLAAATALAYWVRVSIGTGGFGLRLISDAVLVTSVYLATELVTRQTVLSIRSGRPLTSVLRGDFVVQARILLAQVSAAVLITITYDNMREWSLIPVVALLLLMRQSYRLLLEIRETYRTTVELLVEAAEAQDSCRIGHSERTASIARAIATKMGLTISEVELISYAALLHDLDAIAGDVPDPAVQVNSGTLEPVGRSSEILQGVEFFADVMPILRLCDGGNTGVGDLSPTNLISALVVALASDADTAEIGQTSFVHGVSAVDRVAYRLSPSEKARAVSAALSLGFKIPAVG